MSGNDPFGWVGTAIDGRVQIEAVAGEGGFGVVYRAMHLGFEENVAVKCLKLPPGVGARRRDSFLNGFMTEARLLRRLSRASSGIVEAFDVGGAVSPYGIWAPFIVMEWLDGESLEGYLERRKNANVATMGVSDAIRFLAPAAETLSVAHRLGVAHLDIKPANLFIAQTRTGGTFKVLDFGIARVLDSTLIRPIAGAETEENIVAFSPSYGAPEQFDRSLGELGPWTDVFALALVLLEVCSGKPPLGSDSVFQNMSISMRLDERPSFAQLGVSATPALELALGRALTVNPSERLQDVEEFWHALRDALRSVAAFPLSTIVPQPMSARSEDIRSATLLLVRLTSEEEARIAHVAHADDANDNADVKPSTSDLDRLALCGEELGGTAVSWAGSDLAIVFGATRAHTNDPERAVLAALRMRSMMEAGDVRPRCVVIHRGDLSFESTADSLALLSSPALVRSEQILSSRPALEICVTQAIVDRVEGVFNLDEVIEPLATSPSFGATEVRGRIFRVLGTTSIRMPVAKTDFHGLRTRFIGHTLTMSALSEHIDGVLRDRVMQTIRLVAPAGAGRTRVLAETFALIAAHPSMFFVLGAHATAASREIPYSFLISLLRMRFNLLPVDRRDAVREKISSHLSGWIAARAAENREPISSHVSSRRSHRQAEHAESDLHVLLGILAPDSTEPAVRTLSSDDAPTFAPSRIVAALGRLLMPVLAWTPVVILCDDLDAADDASLDLLDDLALRLFDHPLLLVGTVRSDQENRRPMSEGPRVLRLAFDTLAPEELREIVLDRLRTVKNVPASLVETIVERASGIPAVAVDSLQILMDEGVLNPRVGAPWELDAARLEKVVFPLTSDELAHARLRQLDSDERRVLAFAAVIGMTFWEGAVDLLMNAASDTSQFTALASSSTSGILARLRDRRLIVAMDSSTVPTEREYRFTDTRSRDLAYEALPNDAKSTAHAAAVTWLTPRIPIASGAAVIGTHAELAGRFDLAVTELARGATHAAGLGQNQGALRLYKRVIALLGSSRDGSAHNGVPGAFPRVASWQSRVRLHLETGDVLRRLGNLEEAQSSYHEASRNILTKERRAGAPAADNKEIALWHARIFLRLSLAAKIRNDLESALALANDALRDATRARAPIERTAALTALAGIFRRMGRLDEGKEAVLQGLRICKADTSRADTWRETVTHLLIGLGGVFLASSQLVRAERCYRQALRFADETTLPRAAAMALNDLAASRFLMGDYATSRELFLQALALKEREGDLELVAVAHNNVSDVSLRLGDTISALEHSVEAVRLATQIGAYGDLPEMLRILAEAQLANGNASTALATAFHAFELASKTSSVYLADVALSLGNILRSAPHSTSATKRATHSNVSQRAQKRLFPHPSKRP